LAFEDVELFLVVVVDHGGLQFRDATRLVSEFVQGCRRSQRFSEPERRTIIHHHVRKTIGSSWGKIRVKIRVKIRARVRVRVKIRVRVRVRVRV
jgi:hypothetical protein